MSSEFSATKNLTMEQERDKPVDSQQLSLCVLEMEVNHTKKQV